MRLVIVESPYAGAVEANIAYAKAAVRDCLARLEAPIASHLLLTQKGILDDQDPAQRRLGIEAGWAWYRVAEARVFYLDLGMSSGMAATLAPSWGKARIDMATEFRFLGHGGQHDPRETGVLKSKGLSGMQGPWFRWEDTMFQRPSRHQVAHAPGARLEALQHPVPPSIAAHYQARVGSQVVAYYPTLDQAKAGAELFYEFARQQDSEFRSRFMENEAPTGPAGEGSLYPFRR